jgi:L-ascorbate metabolism protein UlaG (beta-lactamase superfamily)
MPAGIALEDLPTIHAVLLSHNHYDHMDIASLNWLYERFAMPIYTGLGNGWYLPKHLQVLEMDWWQSARLHDLKLVYTPAQHGSGRGLRDQNRALWGGFNIHCGADYAYFAGIQVIHRTLKSCINVLAHRELRYCPSGRMNRVS